MATDALLIGPAREADIPALLRLYRVLDREMAAMQPDFYTAAPRDPVFLASVIREAGGEVFLARLAGEAVGFALVRETWTPEGSYILPHRFADLYDLVVDPGARGQGVGRRLVQAVKQWAKGRGLEYVELGILSENAAAAELYDGEGFREASRTLRCFL